MNKTVQLAVDFQNKQQCCSLSPFSLTLRVQRLDCLWSRIVRPVHVKTCSDMFLTAAVGLFKSGLTNHIPITLQRQNLLRINSVGCYTKTHSVSFVIQFHSLSPHSATLTTAADMICGLSRVKLWIRTRVVNPFSCWMRWAKLPKTTCVIKCNYAMEGKRNATVFAAFLKKNFTIFATLHLVNRISKMQCCLNNSSHTFGRCVYSPSTR